MAAGAIYFLAGPPASARLLFARATARLAEALAKAAPPFADAVVCKRWHFSMRRGPSPTLLLRAFALRNGSGLFCRPARHPSAAAALGIPAWPRAPSRFSRGPL